MSKVGARRRRLLGTVALVVLIVAVPLGVYTWGRTSGTFRVRHIVVSGERRAHARALRAVLRERFLGANLFTVTAARVRVALTGFPYVDRVVVDRDFPDTLKVRMTEYVPAARLLSAGHWYVVATGGRVLAEATTTAPASSSPTPTSSTSAAAGVAQGVGATPAATQSPAAGATGSALPSPTGKSSSASPSPTPSSTSLPEPAAGVELPRGARHLPVIVTATPVTVGGTVADAHVRDALTVLAALPRPLRRRALGASATDTSIRVYVKGGATVEFGDTSRLTEKVLVLEAVLRRYRARRATCSFVDVSVPDRPLGAPVLAMPAVQAATPTAMPSVTPSHTPSSKAAGTPKSTPTGEPTSGP
jgi:cell division septal protein FtsQ